MCVSRFFDGIICERHTHKIVELFRDRFHVVANEFNDILKKKYLRILLFVTVSIYIENVCAYINLK